MDADGVSPAIRHLRLRVCSCLVCCCLAPCSFADCDKNTTNGCEVNTLTDISNCGACGQVATLLNANATCTGGQAAIGTCAQG
jgi:hypothetical protein